MAFRTEVEEVPISWGPITGSSGPGLVTCLGTEWPIVTLSLYTELGVKPARYLLYVGSKLELALEADSLEGARKTVEPILRTRYPEWFRTYT